MVRPLEEAGTMSGCMLAGCHPTVLYKASSGNDTESAASSEACPEQMGEGSSFVLNSLI